LQDKVNKYVYGQILINHITSFGRLMKVNANKNLLADAMIGASATTLL